MNITRNRTYTSVIKFLTPKFLRRSVLGIDIGAESVKVVQIRQLGSVIVLETYGELRFDAYGTQHIAEHSQHEFHVESAALGDLIQEIRVSARYAGVSVSQSSTFVASVTLPKRDKEQLEKILPVEAKKYIPVPLDTVHLDWSILPEEVAPINPFDAKYQERIVPHQQTILFVAADNIALPSREEAVRDTGVVPFFLEAEMFAITRAMKLHIVGPTLIVDAGATSVRAYPVTELGVVVNAYVSPIEIISDHNTFEQTTKSHIDGYNTTHARAIKSIVVVGGKAPEIVTLLKKSSLFKDCEVLKGNPFESLRTPMVLEDSINSTGHRYATAVGLALRALQY